MMSRRVDRLEFQQEVENSHTEVDASVDAEAASASALASSEGVLVVADDFVDGVDADLP